MGALLLRGGEERGGEEKERGRGGKGLKPPQSKFSGYVAAAATESLKSQSHICVVMQAGVRNQTAGVMDGEHRKI